MSRMDLPFRDDEEHYEKDDARASLLHQKALDYWLWFCRLQNHVSLVYMSVGLNKPNSQVVSWRSGQMMLMSDIGVPNLDLFSL